MLWKTATQHIPEIKTLIQKVFEDTEEK